MLLTMRCALTGVTFLVGSEIHLAFPLGMIQKWQSVDGAKITSYK